MATDPVISNASLPPEFCETYPLPLVGGCGIIPTYHLNFDGVDDKITIPHAASINNLPLGNFTVEFVANLQVNDSYLISKYNIGHLGWDIEITNHKLSIYVSADGYNFYYSAYFTVQSGLKHYEIVWQVLAPQAQWFVNGILQTQEVENFWGGTYDTDTLDSLIIGGDTNIMSINWIRVSNIARHTSNFTPPSLTVCPSADANTVLRLALDEGSGTTATDTSGNGNNGTIDGATWEAN